MRKRSRVLMTGIVASLVALGACSAETSDKSSADDVATADGVDHEQTPPQPDGDAGDAVLAAAIEATELGRQPQELVAIPAMAEPAKRDGTAVIIPCSFALSCYDQGKAAGSALEELGWSVSYVDGKTAPEPTNSAVMRAVVDEVDGIILIGVPIAFMKQGLEQAKSAGIPVVTITSNNEVGTNGVDAESMPPDQYAERGKLIAEYIIGDSEAQGKVIFLDDTAQEGLKPYKDAFVEKLQECESCELVQNVEFTTADVQTRLPSLVQNSLQRNPNATYIVSPYSGATLFVQSAIDQAGSDIKLVAHASLAENLNAIRNGEILTATVDQSGMYDGWVGADRLLRVIAGEDISQPLPGQWKIIDSTNIDAIPQGEVWEFDYDFRPVFLEAWGY